MRIMPISGKYESATKNNLSSSFKANMVATNEAKEQAYKYLRGHKNMAYLLFHDSINKLNTRIKNQSPLGQSVTLDIAKRGKKALRNESGVQYEIEMNNKTIDYYFNFENILNDPSYHGKSQAEKIDIESTKQADYLYQAFDYLRNLK